MKDIGMIYDKSERGGGIYSHLVRDIVKGSFDAKIYEIIRPKQNKSFNFGLLYYNLSKLQGQKDVWIRTSNSVISLPFDNTTGKNIAIIYHIDSSLKPASTRLLSTILDKVLIHNLNFVDKIVVISQFWRDYFESLSYDSIKVIYNPYDLREFTFDENNIEKFKHKYKLSEKPIIYLGNCQKAKGVIESYESLKGLDAHLVTSGIKDVELPAVHLNVNYKDYLMLLQASSVVITMSKFKEGWCRTAHEAMLCKTPVIGSGKGGMEELLDGGDQIICKYFSKLRENVEYVMEHPELGEKGYKYASQEKFTLQYFETEWVNLIEDVGDY
ncbi:MAG: glycosyltransferase family 4 protein [Methanothrix soehngenii]